MKDEEVAGAKGGSSDEKSNVKVRIKLFGSLRKHMPDGVSGRVGEVQVEVGATVDDLAVQLGIEEVPAVVCINDQETHRARRLQPGDVVTFFPPLAGGV